MPVVDSQTLLLNGFGIFVTCSFLLFVLLKLACSFGLLCFYDIILGALILHFEILSMFISYVVCFMLAVLNVRMMSLCAYHGHGRLSY